MTFQCNRQETSTRNGRIDRCLITVWILGFAVVGASAWSQSVCYGSPAQGRIEGAVQLPSSAENFEAYAGLSGVLGRNYVHQDVAEVVLSAYRQLSTAMPEVRYVYGETGSRRGGRFRPHRTHQNGTSVDFMVPVVDQQGHSVQLPRSMRNRWGYDIEFDRQGRYQDLRIDYAAIGEHLYQLHLAAKAHGMDIALLIFDPQLMRGVYASKHGAYLQRHLPLMKKKPWVRHDEHYHVDFKLPCRAL
ncbi:penicillin-insensitive murein endopeptidase [Undibacterium cyanobacteriorum]|uniref:Penicillin-insensitive murein endopeptidase n=1 Tax=Undibacterium cyanobacteriorum TaxID=3073561 RepID=A0ABY9RIS8_9BURK|nr:penicillin-insensitive murein endopeptidase [Undibacterium sp. 20NA77.5]WMW80743.1 penicillin-insensitive murein endopeptidase [Undibacterium sp. 20NA77.5]